MPPPECREKHPECQMMYENGKRQTVKDCRTNIYFSPCLTDPQTRRYMLDRWDEWMTACDYIPYFPYALGDCPTSFCHCALCRAKNTDKTHKTYAAVMIDFMNEVADRMAQKHPGQSVVLGAYHTYAFVPEGVKVSKNLKAAYCAVSSEKGCNIHLDCEKNIRWRKSIEKWANLLGRENIGVATYDTHNPYAAIDFLEALNKNSSLIFQMYTRSMREDYIAARWNQGDDPAKIVEECNDGIFGKAGKYMTQIDRFVYEYNKNYRHTPNEKLISYGRVQYLSAFNRAEFDKVYELFDRGLALVKGNPRYEIPLLWEKLEFLTMDIQKFPRSSHQTGKEVKAFALRVADFIRTCDPLIRDGRYPYRAAGQKFTLSEIPARQFLDGYCGLTVSNTQKRWTDEPEIKAFMKDPVKSMTVGPITTPGLWSFPFKLLRGGEGSYNAACLRRVSSGSGRIAAVFTLKEPIRGKSLLFVRGWDDEKPGRTTFDLLVNGKKIFSGPNAFPESKGGMLRDDPGAMSFVLPGGSFVTGENTIEFVNTIPDDPKRTIYEMANPLKPEDGMAVKQDYNWGWLAIREVGLLAPEDEWAAFKAGKKSAWSQWMSHKPVGTVKVLPDGSIFIKSAGARYTGIWGHPLDNKWILPSGTTFRLRMKVSGSGKFSAGILAYPVDENGSRMTKGPVTNGDISGNLTAEPKIFEKIITQEKRGLCAPIVRLNGDGEMKIHELSFEPVK